MNSVVRTIGDFDGVALPADVLERAGFAAGDSVEIIEQSDGIKIVRSDSTAGRQIRSAREGMARYRDALSELAK